MRQAITTDTKNEQDAVALLNTLTEQGILKRLESPAHAWDAGCVYYLAVDYPNYGSVTRAVATIQNGRIEWGDSDPLELLRTIMHVYNRKNREASTAGR